MPQCVWTPSTGVMCASDAALSSSIALRTLLRRAPKRGASSSWQTAYVPAWPLYITSLPPVPIGDVMYSDDYDEDDHDDEAVVVAYYARYNPSTDLFEPVIIVDTSDDEDDNDGNDDDKTGLSSTEMAVIVERMYANRDVANTLRLVESMARTDGAATLRARQTRRGGAICRVA